MGRTGAAGSAVIMLLGAVIGLGIALPEEATLNLDPLNRWKEPPLALDLKPRSGPIVIMIEYTIREEDTAPFLEAMAERRRIRRRNGARNWTLARDLENPRVLDGDLPPSDLGGVSPAQPGTTYADQVVADRIRALHSGTEPPRVHRMIERPTSWSDTLFATRSIFELP